MAANKLQLGGDVLGGGDHRGAEALAGLVGVSIDRAADADGCGTLVPGTWTPALTDATPGSRSSTVWIQRSRSASPDRTHIDLHRVHEVTSPLAFGGLPLSGPSGPELTVAPPRTTTSRRR